MIVETGGAPISSGRPALDSESVFRRRAGKQLPARHLKFGYPLDAIDFDLSRLFFLRLIQGRDQILDAPKFSPITFQKRIAGENRSRANMFARNKFRRAERAVRANLINFDAAPETVFAERIDDANHA